MDNAPQLTTAADLEMRAARVADPGIDLKTKYNVACELREMIDVVREAESGRVIPHMVPVLLDILRSGEASFQKDSMEYQFRRCLLDILHRIPSNEAVRPQALTLMHGMLNLLRHDNEENGITCCKSVIELLRTYRVVDDGVLSEFVPILQDLLQNIQGLVAETLAEESAPLDANVIFPARRSFKVLSEVALIVVTLLQTNRQLATAALQPVVPLLFSVICLESQAQKKAREDCEAMGGIWCGMAPSIKNHATYVDMVTAQVKVVSCIAFIFRGYGEQFEGGDTLIVAVVRLLQDIPSASVGPRRDLIVVFRHMFSTPFKRALIPFIDKLLDERVVIGTGVGCKEALRGHGFGCYVDILHQLRSEMSVSQLNRICQIYLRNLHDPRCPNHVHTVCAKMSFPFIESLVIKDTAQGAAKTLRVVLDSTVEKMESLADVHNALYSKIEKTRKGESDSVDTTVIEKSRPIGAPLYALEKPEDVLTSQRELVRLLLQGFRAILAALKKCDAPVPEGTIVIRLFESAVRCITLFEGDQREAVECMEILCNALLEVNLHVFQEVWSQKIGFFFENAEKRPALMNLAHSLFNRDVSSPTITAIVLRYLVARLPQLGEYDDQKAAVTIRMFKMAFSAVSMHGAANEPILAHHLGKIIMDSFPLAAKATKPINYFHLLRLLFRAIGGGGGRFELLYKEVLPLLPEMLECLTRQLNSSEGMIRDMIVELCLTVPLRLTHLLPYLSYLMKPLVLALRGNPELVSQGLRTLELCIDNLTPDFLDPTLNIVLRDLMEALHSHLKPLPANHHHSHTTIRILGKLGGRNRRLLDKEPVLKYHEYAEPATSRISFGGAVQAIELRPLVPLASSTLVSGKGGATYRVHSYDYLESCVTLLLHEGLRGRDREAIFVQCMQGLFHAIHIPELQERAEKTVREVSLYILSSEARRPVPKDMFAHRLNSPLLLCYLEALPHGMARENLAEAKKIHAIVFDLMHELAAMLTQPDVTAQQVVYTFTMVADRFSLLCIEETWVLKSAGCSGIGIMTQIPGPGVRWIVEREVDLVKSLLLVLKDMPYEVPRDMESVTEVLTQVVRVGSADLGTPGDEDMTMKSRFVNLITTLFGELSSPSAMVRKAVQKCIQLLAELSGKTPAELFIPHRDRLLSKLYTKPLRALPFPIQIGMLEALRYCISLQPPLPDLSEELLRLLHETLALADADDVTLIARTNPRQSSLEIIKLRVSCIKLLTASMSLTDFFARQPQTRQKVTSVYFKSLYSPVQEIKEVAHEGLCMVLTHQSRLPRELLQTGLRPILMNLADPKRLSISGLEGLARLLELLTNYFKVEIGHKLLDHFRVVADPQMLQASSRLPLTENEGITKLVRLANIFHLLPSAANIFLENLVNAIVQTEAQMHFSGRSPFSEPLAKYLNRYPVDAVEFFMRHLHFPRHVRTLRSILQAKLASGLLRELASRTSTIVGTCFDGREPTLILPGLLICTDLADLVPDWLQENQDAIDAMLNLWSINPSSLEQSGPPVGEITQRYKLLANIFIKALRQTPRIDLLFDLVAIFSHTLPIDLIHVSQFLYEHVAFSNDLAFRRNVLTRFIIWFRDTSVPWSHKTHFLRFVFTPTILVHAARSPTKTGLIDESLVNKLHMHIWQPMNDDATLNDADDSVKIELLHLTTVMVHRYPELLPDAKKDIIRCAWHYITSEDAVVKQTAYLLAARFFEAFEGPQKFHLRVWTGLLKPPHTEGKTLTRQALDIIAPVLLRSQSPDTGYPQWAKTTRRLLAEEGAGWQQIGMIYQLIVRQAALFYPVRALFIPHIVNYVPKLGLAPSASNETRLLSIEILQVIFDWEQKATASKDDISTAASTSTDAWITPLPFRESMVSYLVRLATTAQEQQGRKDIVSRALSLLRLMVGPGGWSDVTFKLHYFSRALEQNDVKGDASALSQAQSAAKVLQVISADKTDLWFISNAVILTKLVKKGLSSEDVALQDSLHPIFDRLVRLFPLPKEEDDQQTDASDFHSFVYTSISENLRNADELRNTSWVILRGSLSMLKSVAQVVPERIEPFSTYLMKLLVRLAKDHIQSSPSTPGFETTVRLVTTILEISHISVAHLGEQRKALLSALSIMVEKSKSGGLCRYMLDIARDWVMNKRDPYPTMKEKAALLQKMAAFEMRGERGEALFNSYLELIYEIYTDPSLRRTDLTTRLEQPFLLGCRATDIAIRERFVDLIDVSIPRPLYNRLTYILGVQSWEALSDHYWLFLALHLLLGSADMDIVLTPDRKDTLESTFTPPPLNLGCSSTLLRPLQRLAFFDSQVVHEVWISVFPAAWACLSRREQIEITHHMIVLLSKEYHIRQTDLRPNVIQTILAGIQACDPPMSLPPHLVKYLAKTFGAWHVSSEILQSSLLQVRDDEAVVRDTTYDSLAEIYAELAEEDLFYGLWRRRSLFSETNTAIAFEQSGMWDQAMSTYETAQGKTRAGTLPFSEAEFCLWEDHWVLASEKLQQWDGLLELARVEGNHELMLESAWRVKDWSASVDELEAQISQLPDVATPRRRVFEAFIALLKLPGALEKNLDFTRLLEDAMQLSLRKWVSLPPNLSAAHIPLLQHFQQFVELQEAVQIFGSLSTTTALNLEKKSSDLKMVLQAWRERLPNVCDDISIWSDLVAWRQNVFQAINKTYIPLINPAGSNGSAGGNSPTFGYRGYHETAWIINRFAHVARKHDLLEVCGSQLARIYTLPNIEISEAFLKLREQARCHYQKPGDLQAGLEVINNTNLMYFSNSQKAEFYTLKGMFHAKFGRADDANQAFGQAVQLDMNQAKAWAAWGRFNDQMFKDGNDMAIAANAVSCYLQAAGLYKSRKSRPLLTRVLWLLSVDDFSYTISRAFDTYRGDAAFWYWITLIPQLLLSVGHREVKQARYILLNLAKLYPQALYFQLRTTKEDMTNDRRRLAMAAQRVHNAGEVQTPTQGANGELPRRSDSGPSGHDMAGESTVDVKPNTSLDDVSRASAMSSHATAEGLPIATRPPTVSTDTASHPARQTWDYVDEVVQMLKTAFPLLVVSMEGMVEQVQNRFRGGHDEEVYRLLCMVATDAMNQYMIRISNEDDNQTPPQSLNTLFRAAQNIPPPRRKEWEDDFLKEKLDMSEFIRRLQRWQAKYERYFDARPRFQPLDIPHGSLMEFQHTKFDDIEVPGQYTEDKDSNQNFVKVSRFDPRVENCRTFGYCWKRLTIHGHDASKTTFAVQNPAARHCRREERVMQLFRTFNGALYRKKESRKRNLHFHLPVIVPFTPSLRLVQNDSSYVTLGDIYDQHCLEAGFVRDDPILLIGEKAKATLKAFRETHGRKLDNVGLKKELMDEVTLKMVPDNIITRYLIRTMDGACELWRMRKQFASQVASTSFMTYLLLLSYRAPSRFHLSRTTGQIALSEVLPSHVNTSPIFGTIEQTPFRLTPNMQHFIGPLYMDGILACGIMSIGRCLTEPEFDLENQLCLFIRDEVIYWIHTRGKPWSKDHSLRAIAQATTEGVVQRAETLACKLEREQALNNPQTPGTAPVLQTVTNLISAATNPVNLAKMNELNFPWF